MEANVFEELLKYASYTKKKPRENVFTGSFAFLLSNNDRVRVAFIQEVIDRHRSRFPSFKKPGVHLKDLEVFPQSCNPRCLEDLERDKSGKRDQVDIEIGDSDRRFGIFVENKIGSNLGPAQDERYQASLKRKYKTGILVFITLSGRRRIDPKVRHIQMRWAEVYDLLVSCVSQEKHPVQEYLLRSLIEYMEEENMGSFKGIKKRDYSASGWREYCDLVSRMEMFFEGLRAKVEDAGHKTMSIRAKKDSIYFYVIPDQVNRKKSLRAKWKKQWAHIQFEIFLYADESDYIVDGSEPVGPWCCVSIWRAKPIEDQSAVGKKLKGTGFYFIDEYVLCRDEWIGRLLGKAKDPKVHEAKLTKFYLDSFNNLVSKGIVEHFL